MTERDTTTVPNPWSDNKGGINFYNKCSKYAETEEDLLEMIDISPSFVVFGVIIIFIIFIINLWLLCYYKTYIFQRQCVKYYLCLLIGSELVLIDDLLLEIYYVNYPCIIHHLSTAISYPTYLGGVLFIVVKYFKYYYKSQVAYFNSFLGSLDEKENGTFNKKFFFKYFYTACTSTKILNALMIFNAISVIYSIIMYFTDDLVKGSGFCGIRLSYLPQVLEFAIIVIIIFPVVLIEAMKFDDKFRMKKSIILLITLQLFCYIGFLLISWNKKLLCSRLVKYIPPGFFVFISCLICTLLFSLSMLQDIRHINKRNKDLKINYQAMTDMLKDKIQLREFGEYCRYENCVENILFYQEYWRYKNLFNKNERTSSNRDSLQSQEFSDSDSKRSFKMPRDESIQKNSFLSRLNERANSIIGTTSIIASTVMNEGKEKSEKSEKSEKAYFNIIEKEAKKFYDNFIASNAIYEINIQSTIIKYINEKMKLLEDEFESDLTMEDKIDEYYVIFDKAYKEVIDNIYLNSYSNYVHLKDKSSKK